MSDVLILNSSYVGDLDMTSSTNLQNRHCFSLMSVSIIFLSDIFGKKSRKARPPITDIKAESLLHEFIYSTISSEGGVSLLLTKTSPPLSKPLLCADPHGWLILNCSSIHPALYIPIESSSVSLFSIIKRTFLPQFSFVNGLLAEYMCLVIISILDENRRALDYAQVLKAFCMTLVTL